MLGRDRLVAAPCPPVRKTLRVLLGGPTVVLAKCTEPRWSERTHDLGWRRVGRELIEQGHSLIVGTDSKNTADGNAALGAIEAVSGAGDTPRIALIRRESPGAKRPFAALRASVPGVFVEQPVDDATWAVVKTVQTQLADAVILVGGPRRRSRRDWLPQSAASHWRASDRSAAQRRH